MGNRAVITIRDNLKNRDDWQSIYLHWNGGYDTVKPALDLAKEYGVRCEQEYGIARLNSPKSSGVSNTRPWGDAPAGNGPLNVLG